MKHTAHVEYTGWARQACKVGLIGSAIGFAGIAFAGPKQFSSNETLTADDLNGSFSGLDTRLTAVEKTAPILNSTAVQTNASFNVDGSGAVGGLFSAKTLGVGTDIAQGAFHVNGFGRTLSTVFNYGSVAEFHGGSSRNNGIIFDSGAPPGPQSLRGLAITSASQGFAIARFDAAGVAAPTYDVFVTSNGRVGIGTDAPDRTLSVNGDASMLGGGSWFTYSDERLKDIKGPFTAGLDELMKLHPIRYEYKHDNALGIASSGEHIGFSAQAVSKVIPEAVSTNAAGYLMMNDDPILWTMLNAVQDQQREIEVLRGAEDRTARLEKENADLRKRLDRLERLMGDRAAH